MKKTWALILSGVMAVGMLTGCGGASSADSGNSGSSTASNSDAINIKIGWWGNQVRNEATQLAAEKYMELHPDIHIDLEFTDWSGYWDKLSAEAAGGNLPDVVQMDYSYLEQYAKNNQLADLTEYLGSNIDTSKIADSILESGMIDDKTYAISLGSTAPALFYDVETIEAAGVTIPDSPTYEDILSIGQTIYEKTGVPTIFDDENNGSVMFCRAYGKVVYDELETGNVELMTNFFNWSKTFADDPCSITNEKRAEKSTTQVEMFPLVDQSAWCAWAYSNQYAPISAAAGREIGIATCPAPADTITENMYLKPTMFFSVAETSQHKQAAADFINWFVNDIECNQILKAERGMPINTDVAEAVKSEVDENTAKAFNYIAQVTKFATKVNPPDPSGKGEVDAKTIELSENVRIGAMTPEQAAEELVAQGQSILSAAK